MNMNMRQKQIQKNIQNDSSVSKNDLKIDMAIVREINIHTHEYQHLHTSETHE